MNPNLSYPESVVIIVVQHNHLLADHPCFNSPGFPYGFRLMCKFLSPPHRALDNQLSLDLGLTLLLLTAAFCLCSWFRIALPSSRLFSQKGVRGPYPVREESLLTSLSSVK